VGRKIGGVEGVTVEEGKATHDSSAEGDRFMYSEVTKEEPRRAS